MTELPKCPTCGKTVEYFSRYGWWSGRAEIRCVGHHSFGMTFGLGSHEKARELLIEKWNELGKEKNNG